MSHYTRLVVPGGTYFFTVRLQDRGSRLLTDQVDLLRSSVRLAQKRWPFVIAAAVVLPDHLHMIWTLPQNDPDFSKRWRMIKSTFSRHVEGPSDVSPSLARRGEKGIWQRRFWEHTVRVEDDLKRCVDYVHWNPRKHNVAARVQDWPWSTFHRFVKEGEYDLAWGGTDPCPNYDTPEWNDE